MTVPLPRHPNLDYIKKQAKQLLAAHKNGMTQSCQFWKRLNRFSDASDEEILAANLTLADAQYVVGLHYGFDSWAKLRDEVLSYPGNQANSLESVEKRSKHEVPVYAGAGVALAVVCALNHERVDIDIVEFAAVSGWAFSFGYKYNDLAPAYHAVRGNPDEDGPSEVFAFLPKNLGFDYEMALTSDADGVWDFVRRHVDAGTPVMSEHFDGGLMTAYRVKGKNRQIFFDGTAFPGWTDVDKLHPYAVYTLKKARQPLPDDQIRELALRRAVAKGQAHTWKGTPQGLAALQAYLGDIGDVQKDFADHEEWFCWAAFERLMARRCCELWLRSCAKSYGGNVGSLLEEAAKGYGEAFSQFEQYRAAVQDHPPRMSLKDRARTPERVATITPILASAIEAESSGLNVLAKAVDLLSQ